MSTLFFVQLISGSLNKLIVHKLGNNHSLVGWIAATHVIYQSVKPEIFWFGQLTSQMPGILELMQGTIDPGVPEMARFILYSLPMIMSQQSMSYFIQTLHILALEKALGILEPPMSTDKSSSIKLWVNNVRISQSSVDSILSLPSPRNMHERARYLYCIS